MKKILVLVCFSLLCCEYIQAQKISFDVVGVGANGEEIDGQFFVTVDMDKKKVSCGSTSFTALYFNMEQLRGMEVQYKNANIQYKNANISKSHIDFNSNDSQGKEARFDEDGIIWLVRYKSWEVVEFKTKDLKDYRKKYNMLLKSLSKNSSGKIQNNASPAKTPNTGGLFLSRKATLTIDDLVNKPLGIVSGVTNETTKEQFKAFIQSQLSDMECEIRKNDFYFDIDEASNYKSTYGGYVPSSFSVLFDSRTGKYEDLFCCFRIHASHPNIRKSKARQLADKVKRELKNRGYTFEEDKDPDYWLYYGGFNKERTRYANISITDYPEFEYCYVQLHFGYW